MVDLFFPRSIDLGFVSCFLLSSKATILGYHACYSESLMRSINLLVVYRESVNLIGYITRRLSADSQQL